MTRVPLMLLMCVVLASCASRQTAERRQEALDNARRAAAETPHGEPYHVAASDTLRVEYFYNQELNRVVVVRPDGYITLPLLDDVKVADKTIDEVNKELIGRYKGLLKNPTVTVSLENPGSFKVYVGGEVSSPGVFVLAEGVTVLRAISMAGGSKTTARLNSVLVIRDQATAKPQYLMVDLRSGLSGLQAGQDLPLRPKDMVFVPKSNIARIDQFVDQYMNQLVPFQKSLGVTYIFGRPVY